MTGNSPLAVKRGHSITVFQACQCDISVTLYIFDTYRVIAVFSAWMAIFPGHGFIASLHKHEALLRGNGSL